MEAFQIPKREVAGMLSLHGTKPRAVTLFLSSMAENHRGPERPSDLLERPEPFLPVRDAEDGHRLVARAEISELSVSWEDEAGDRLTTEDLAADLATTLAVDGQLIGGRSFTGTLAYILPEGRRRLQDFLNDERVGFMVLRDGTRAVLVNRSHIMWIRGA